MTSLNATLGTAQKSAMVGETCDGAPQLARLSAERRVYWFLGADGEASVVSGCVTAASFAWHPYAVGQATCKLEDEFTMHSCLQPVASNDIPMAVVRLHSIQMDPYFR